MLQTLNLNRLKMWLTVFLSRKKQKNWRKTIWIKSNAPCKLLRRKQGGFLKRSRNTWTSFLKRWRQCRNKDTRFHWAQLSLKYTKTHSLQGLTPRWCTKKLMWMWLKQRRSKRIIPLDNKALISLNLLIKTQVHSSQTVLQLHLTTRPFHKPTLQMLSKKMHQFLWTYLLLRITHWNKPKATNLLLLWKRKSWANKLRRKSPVRKNPTSPIRWTTTRQLWFRIQTLKMGFPKLPPINLHCLRSLFLKNLRPRKIKITNLKNRK